MDEIDKLLANLNPSPKPPGSNPSQPAKNPANSKSIEDLLAQIGAPKPQPAQPATPPPQRLFEEMKAEHEEQQAELERQKQQRLEQLKQKRRLELAEKAEQWLKALDPKSSEGRWFEEFSCNYSSRLEAAIDYLEALQELE